MPLLTGSDNKTIGKNISELRSSGYKPKQAIAIALREAGKGQSKAAEEIVREISGSASKQAAFVAFTAELTGASTEKTAFLGRLLGGAAAGGLGGAAAGALGARGRGEDMGSAALKGGLGGAALGAGAGALSSLGSKGLAGMGIGALTGEGPLKSVLPGLAAGAATGLGAGAFGALRGAVFGAPEQETSREKELGKIEAQQAFKAQQRAVLEPKHQQALQMAMRDPQVQQAPQELIHSSFSTMQQFAPNLAADPNAVRSFLRESAVYGEGPSYAMLKNLADAESAVARAGGAL